MRVFLGFGKPQLPPACRGHHLAKRTPDCLWAEQCRHFRVERRRIGGHSNRGGEPWWRRDAVRLVRIEPAGQKLAHPIGAEIDHHHGIAIAHAVIAGNDARGDEFVTLVIVIGMLKRRQRVCRGRVPARRLHNCRKGLCGALPSMVAVHRPIAADQSGEGDIAGKRGQKSRQRSGGVLWQHVAAIGKTVYDDIRSCSGKSHDHGQHLVLMRMDTTRRQQPHHMNSIAGTGKFSRQCGQRRMRRQRPVGHRGIDSRQILLHHAAGTDIHMANLGIADLTFGKPDIWTGGGKPGMRPAHAQRINHRRAGAGYGVGFWCRAKAPAIHDTQDDRWVGHGGIWH